MYQSFARSESFDQAMATWHTPPDDTYRLPEVDSFEMCECEQDWGFSTKGGCGCGGSSGCGAKGDCGCGGCGGARAKSSGLEAPGAPGIEQPDIPPPQSTYEVLEWDCPPWKTFFECHPVQSQEIQIQFEDSSAKLSGFHPVGNCDDPGRVEPHFFEPPNMIISPGPCQQEQRNLEDNIPLCATPPVNVWKSAEVDCGCDPAMIPWVTGEEVKAQDPSLRPIVGAPPTNLFVSGFSYFNQGDPNDPKAAIQVTSKDVEYLLIVWKFLVQNVDIAEWIVCLLEGPDNAKCVGNKLRGMVIQEISLDVGLPFGCPKDAGACTTFIGSKINIDITATSWVKARDMTLSSTEPLTWSDRLCAVVDWAYGLLHELTHSCLAVFTQNFDDTTIFSEEPRGCGCDTPDMVESSFVWAIAQRYPCLDKAKPCNFFDKDCVWLSPCDFAMFSQPCNCDSFEMLPDPISGELRPDDPCDSTDVSKDIEDASKS